MLVSHLVNRNVPTTAPSDDVLAAARRMLEWRCGAMPVVTDDGHGARLVGVLRYRDVLPATFAHAEHATVVSVATAMEPAEPLCRASDSVGLALRILRRSGLDELAVVDGDGYLVGVLSIADLVREAAR